jgi:hypothetical protein
MCKMVCNIQTSVVQFKFQKFNTSELLQVPHVSTKNNQKNKRNFDFRRNIAKFSISFLVWGQYVIILLMFRETFNSFLETTVNKCKIYLGMFITYPTLDFFNKWILCSISSSILVLHISKLLNFCSFKNSSPKVTLLQK